MKIKIGTRGSKLALAQCDEIINLLKTSFNGTTFMRKLVDLRSNYEEEE